MKIQKIDWSKESTTMTTVVNALNALIDAQEAMEKKTEHIIDLVSDWHLKELSGRRGLERRIEELRERELVHMIKYHHIDNPS